MSGKLTEGNMQIRELCLGNNLSYVIAGELGFSQPVYYFVRGGKDLFVPSMKVSINGENAIYFRVDNLARLDYYLRISSEESYLNLLRELAGTLAKVCEDGSFLFENFVLNIERVYVDGSSGKVKLLYIPAEKPVYRDNCGKLRELCDMVTEQAQTDWKADCQIRTEARALKDLSRRISNTAARAEQNEATQETGLTAGNAVRIVGTGSAEGISFTIKDPVFVIGRSAQQSDGVIDRNLAVSRSHCRIERKDGRLSITDLNSKYGTFVNGVRVAEKPVDLKNKDRIRIANYDFTVETT